MKTDAQGKEKRQKVNNIFAGNLGVLVYVCIRYFTGNKQFERIELFLKKTTELL